MAVGLSAANLANSWLNMLRGTAFTAPAGTFVKLHTADPGASGATAASANTTRVAATFSAASGGVLTMSNSPAWASWASGSETISHISVWDASTAGNFLYSVALTVAKAVTNGDTFTLSSHTFTLTPVAA